MGQEERTLLVSEAWEPGSTGDSPGTPKKEALVSVNMCKVSRGLGAESLQEKRYLDTKDHTHERSHGPEHRGSHPAIQLVLLRPKDPSGKLAAGLIVHPGLIFMLPSPEDIDHQRVCIINVKNPICEITELSWYI